MAAVASRRWWLLHAGLAAAGLLYSGLLFGLSFQYTFEARIFAQVASGLGVATALAYLVVSVRRYLISPTNLPAAPLQIQGYRRTALRMAYISAVILASVALLYAFGVYVYSFVFVFVFLRFFAEHSWRASLLTGLGVLVFNYVTFAVIFQLRFSGVGGGLRWLQGLLP